MLRRHQRKYADATRRALAQRNMAEADGAVTLTNAYAILSNIQGFDSFQLGPSSSTDEITRAFQTQSLIWHPEKNVGDLQALQVYKRMQQAYNLLMHAPSREAHDRRQGLATADRALADGTAEQRPSEDLGAPPPTARPFAFVDKEPHPRTPALFQIRPPVSQSARLPVVIASRRPSAREGNAPASEDSSTNSTSE